MGKLEKVILGTAQWGLNYGISNRKGQLKSADIEEILELSSINGCRALDTASVYGNSETIIGGLDSSEFEVITKLPKVQDRIHTEENPLKSELFASMARLKRTYVSGLLLHDASDLLGDNALAVFRRLEQLKELGYVLKIGVSVYTYNEANVISRHFPVDLVQLPYNILSPTYESLSALDGLKSRGVEVHARSVFLQGLLLMDPLMLPPKLEVFREYILGLRSLALEQNVSFAQYLMRFPLHGNKVDKVVLGVTDIHELLEQTREHPIVDYSSLSKLKFEHFELLDPRNW